MQDVDGSLWALIQRLRTYGRAQARRHMWVRKVIQVVALVSTTAAGCIEVFGRNLSGEAVVIADTTQIFSIGLAAICALLLLIIDDTGPELLRDAEEAVEFLGEAEDESADLADDLDQTTQELIRAQTIFGVSKIFEEAVDAAIIVQNTPQQRIKVLYTLLELLVGSKMELFGMGDEQWNFAIYMWSQDEGKLKCVACRRISKLDEDAEHRMFGPGQGHVGKAFQDRKRLICPDSKEPTISELVRAPGGLYRDGDEDKYRSLAAFPIMLNPEADPIGVVVASSDVANRFTHTDASGAFPRTEPLAALARTLATLEAVYTLTERKEHTGAH